MMQFLFRDTWGSVAKKSAGNFLRRAERYLHTFTTAHTVHMFEVCQRTELADLEQQRSLSYFNYWAFKLLL